MRGLVRNSSKGLKRRKATSSTSSQWRMARSKPMPSSSPSGNGLFVQADQFVAQPAQFQFLFCLSRARQPAVSEIERLVVGNGPEATCGCGCRPCVQESLPFT
jgi:hypothetical protein